MKPLKAALAKDWLYTRLSEVLDWYTHGAVNCEETRANISTDVMSVLEEFKVKYKLLELPFTIRTQITDEGEIIVTAIDRKVS
jgi:hypothetical protein